MKTRFTISTTLALVAIAAFAIPASASPRYDGQLAVQATGQSQQSSASPPPSDSINALLAPAQEPNGVVLRRDGSRAVPVELDTTGTPADDGFDWGYVAIGVGGAFALALLAGGIGRMSSRRVHRAAHA